MKKANRLTYFFAPVIFFAMILLMNVLSVKADTITCQQVGQTATTVSISWDEAENAEKYYFGWGETVQEARANVEKIQDKCDGKYNSHTITGLKSGTKYYVCISCKVAVSNYVKQLVNDFEVYTLPSGKTTGVKCDVVDLSLRTATFSWKEQTGVSGYEYKLLADGKTVESGATMNAGDTQVQLDIKKNSFYTFKVRAYSDKTGARKYGKWSTELNFAPQPGLTKASTSRNGLSIKWNKLTGAKNYTVYVSTSPKKGYKKIGTTTKTSYTIKDISGSKFNKTDTYYVYVIANKTINGKTLSSIKSGYYAVKDAAFTPEVF